MLYWMHVLQFIYADPVYVLNKVMDSNLKAKADLEIFWDSSFCMPLQYLFCTLQ